MEVQKFQYGNDFIIKLIASTLTNTKFLLKCLELEIWKYIESEPHQWLIKQIIDYYVLYKGTISLDSLKLKLDDVKQIVLKQSISNIYVVLLQTLDELQTQQSEFIQDTAINFCRRQELKFALVQSIDLWQSNGQYQKIYDIINKTRYKGLQTNFGVQYVSSFFDRHAMTTQKTIQSPWPIINNVIKGGFKESRLYLLLAPSGVGKSWMFCNIAAEAMKHHKNVIYYALQMTQFEIGQRIDSKLLGKPIEYIRHPKNINHMNQLIQPYKDYLRIVEMLPNKTRVLDIENHYNQLKLYENFQADIIIIDYGDILKKQSNINNMYTAYGDVFTALKTLAKQYKIPVISASQGGRCLSLNTLVNQQNKGQIELCKLEVGDKVQTPNGFRQVLTIFPVEVQPMHKIKLKSGRDIICSVNHQFPTRYGQLKALSTGLKVGEKIFIKKTENNVQYFELQLDEIVQICFMGEMQSIDIQIDGDHVFLANEILTHNSSMNSEIILGDQVSHSIGKIQIADFVLSISRTHADRMSNTARFTVVKNRGGRDGMVYNGYVDLQIGSIQMYDNYTKKSVEARQPKRHTGV